MALKFGIGWRQVASCFVLIACIGLITASYGIVAVPLAREFHPSRMVLMLAITVVALVSLVLAPVAGSLMDRLSLRKLMLLGALFLGAGYAAVSYATSFTQVLLAFGLLLAPANVLLGPMAATVLLSRWFSKRRGRAIGIAIAGVALGGVLFPPLMQWLIHHFEWRVGLRVFAGILLVVTLSAAALVVNSPADRGLHPDGIERDPEAVRAAAMAPKASVAAILSDPTFWLVGLVFAIATSCSKGVITNLAPLATDQGVDPSDAALLISVYAGCSFASKLSFALIADRFGPRLIAVLSFAGFAAGMACLSQAAAGYWVIALGVGMTGLFSGFAVPLQSLLVPQIFGQNVVGRAMGLMSTIGLCASLATPPVFGLLFDLTGNYMLVSIIFAALLAVAALAVPYIRMHPRDIPPSPGPLSQQPA